MYRNYDDPEYKAWRLAVYRRDKFTCRMPGCKSKKRINAHHIHRWADFPELRFVLSNGITLCKAHHDLIRNQEEIHVELFMSIISPSSIDVKGMIRNARKT